MFGKPHKNNTKLAQTGAIGKRRAEQEENISLQPWLKQGRRISGLRD